MLKEGAALAPGHLLMLHVAELDHVTRLARQQLHLVASRLEAESKERKIVGVGSSVKEGGGRQSDERQRREDRM